MAKDFKDKIKEMFSNMDKSDILNVLFGASTLRDFAKTEEGKKIKETLVNKIFGIGPNDEKLFQIAINFMIEKIRKITDPDQVKAIRKKVNKFLEDLDANGYSRWWFRNVLVTSKGEAKDESSAATTLSHIMEGDDFNEMIQLAGPDLIHKSYKKKISEGWELVIGKNGEMNVLIDYPKFYSKFREIIESKIGTAKADAKKGFIEGTVFFWKMIGILVLVFFLFWLY